MPSSIRVMAHPAHTKNHFVSTSHPRFIERASSNGALFSINLASSASTTSPSYVSHKTKIELKGQKKPLPPGPTKLPIIGNLHQLGALPHYSLWQLSKKYGSIMLLQLGVPTVVVSSAEAAREFLKTHDIDCCSRPPLVGPGKFSYNHRDIGFAPYGDYWREVRKICVLEVFSTKRVQSFQFIREEEVTLLIDSIAQSSSSGSPIDLTERLMSLTANIICRIAFGKSFQASEFGDGRFQEVVHEAMALLGGFTAADFFPYVGRIVDRLTGLHGRLERSFLEMDGFYQRVIEDHLNPGRVKEEHEDIIDVLLKIERERSESGAVQFTKDSAKAILMDLFLAGVDTGAITLTWAMTELARNPRIMKKAQVEVRNSIGNKGKVTEGDVDQLHYLKMVVKETLRLHPPAPLLVPRETMSHFEIKRVPHLPENPSPHFRGQHFELLPFGAGRRICPGMYMAIATVELALANLLYRFNWNLPNGMREADINMEEAAGITVRKKFALNLVPILHHC
ncbi:Cytochrome P450 71B36 [Vitis vinifera]|uniref:Cytochrome P450 71B36 n=1 Tax=Vitis vinifera TaxID=29760 RepID=A0A438J668_VITVI|nr:Cytochrome P450 71B36 [Vitis vinifera]